MRFAMWVVLVAFCSATLGARSPLELRVHPARCTGPCTVRMTVRTERHADNRGIILEIDSTAFFRSSLIPLDGRDAPLVHYYELDGVPTGDYHVQAVLIRGEDAIARDTAQLQVLWSLGQKRRHGDGHFATGRTHLCNGH